jgi:hypothetical protein
LKKNMVDDALPISRSLVAAEPNNANFRMHLGMALLGKGNNSLAKKEFEAALGARHSPGQAKRLRELLARTAAL